MPWDKVETLLPYAKAIVWDGCHKLYLAMDDTEVQTFRGYGYGRDEGTELITLEPVQGGMPPVQALEQLHRWFDESCGLRFVNAVRTVEGNPNDGFQTLIEQFEYDQPDDEDDEGMD